MASAPPLPPAAAPGQIKVLGILHLVLAGLGVVLSIIGVVMLFFKDALFRFSSGASVGTAQEAQAKFSQSLMEATKVTECYGYAASAVLAVLLLVAGIGLLRRKRSGLRWSNVYAWTSLADKLVRVVLFGLFVIPKLDHVFAELGASDPVFKSMAEMMRVTTVISSMAMPVLYCIYPVFVLILLNRESVRKSLS